MKQSLSRAMLFALSAASVVIPTLARADAAFTVNSTLDQLDEDINDGQCRTDTGTCTLRAAIMQANNTPYSITIMVPAGTYVLTRPPTGYDGDDSGDLNLTTPVSGSPVITITGVGPTLTIIDANQTDRIFYIEPGRTAIIGGVTVRNGYQSSTYPGASAGLGGGILNSGVLTLTNVTVRDNYADYEGGGVANYGQLGIYSSTLTANVSNQCGGGLESFNGGVTIVRSTIYGNSAGLDGGGIDSQGTAILTNSTVSQNSAGENGGGIDTYALGTMSLYNATIISNTALTGFGAGLYITSSGVSSARNSLIVGNYLAGQPVYDDCAGPLTVYGVNLVVAAPDCTVSGPGSLGTLNSIDLIGPLRDNGGPTYTHALLPGSNAIDGATQGDCVDENGDTLATDQRDQPRISGVRCDIGSFEFSDMIFKNGFD